MFGFTQRTLPPPVCPATAGGVVGAGAGGALWGAGGGTSLPASYGGAYGPGTAPGFGAGGVGPVGGGAGGGAGYGQWPGATPVMPAGGVAAGGAAGGTVVDAFGQVVPQGAGAGLTAPAAGTAAAFATLATGGDAPVYRRGGAAATTVRSFAVPPPDPVRTASSLQPVMHQAQTLLALQQQLGVGSPLLLGIAASYGSALATAAAPQAGAAAQATRAIPGAPGVGVPVGGMLTGEQVVHLDEQIDRAVRPAMGPAGVPVPPTPLDDAAAPLLFASFTPSLGGNDDGPADAGMLGATRGVSTLVARAERRLEAESRATPPKQILQMIVGRTQFVNLRSFAPVDLKAIAAANNGVTGLDVAIAGGAVVKASGKPRPKAWPEVVDFEGFTDVVDGMLIALAEAPPIMRDGLERVPEAFRKRRLTNPELTWPRMFRLLHTIAQKRAEMMLRAETQSVGVQIQPWDVLDVSSELTLATEVVVAKRDAESGAGAAEPKWKREAADLRKELENLRKKVKKEPGAGGGNGKDKGGNAKDKAGKDKSGGGQGGGGQGGAAGGADKNKKGDEWKQHAPNGFSVGDELGKWVIDGRGAWSSCPATQEFCRQYCKTGSCEWAQKPAGCRFKHAKPPTLPDDLYHGT